MSLLRDIQKAAIEQSTDIPTLLRMCKLLAARLGNSEFGLWVDHELNGYPTVESMPAYRIVEVQSFGNFIGPFNSSANNMPITLGVLPEQARDVYQKAYLGLGVSAYASLVASGKDGSLEEPWPIDVALRYGSKAMRNMQCVSAWKSIPHAAVVGFLDQVKTRVLAFAIEIEKQAPDAGESPVNSPPLKQDVVTQIFHTEISGNVQNFSSGNANVTQGVHIEICRGDIAALEEAVRSLGVDDKELAALRVAISHDEKQVPPSPFDGHTGNWLKSVLGRAATGGLKVGVDVASGALAKFIAAYFGLT